MDWIILITVGLMLDMCGAYLIVKKVFFPYLPSISVGAKLSDNYKNKPGKIEEEEIMNNAYRESYLHKNRMERDEKISTKNWAQWGLCFLLVGFVFQIIGNLWNYYTN